MKTYSELLAEMSIVDKNKARSLAAQIIAHHIKIESAPIADRERYYDHWAKEVGTFRRELRDHLASKPSLRHHFDDEMLRQAHREASKELMKYRAKDGKSHPFVQKTLSHEEILGGDVPPRPE